MPPVLRMLPVQCVSRVETCGVWRESLWCIVPHLFGHPSLEQNNQPNHMSAKRQRACPSPRSSHPMPDAIVDLWMAHLFLDDVARATRVCTQWRRVAHAHQSRLDKIGLGPCTGVLELGIEHPMFQRICMRLQVLRVVVPSSAIVSPFARATLCALVRLPRLSAIDIKRVHQGGVLLELQAGIAASPSIPRTHLLLGMPSGAEGFAVDWSRQTVFWTWLRTKGIPNLEQLQLTYSDVLMAPGQTLSDWFGQAPLLRVFTVLVLPVRVGLTTLLCQWLDVCRQQCPRLEHLTIGFHALFPIVLDSVVQRVCTLLRERPTVSTLQLMCGDEWEWLLQDKVATYHGPPRDATTDALWKTFVGCRPGTRDVSIPVQEPAKVQSHWCW